MVKEIYTEYPTKVLNGEIIACEYVKLACTRFFKWLERDDIEFRDDKVDKVISFIGKLKHSTGSFANKPFTLLPWQIFLVANVYGWYYKGSEKRVTRSVFVEVGRKAGKTELLAALALYNLIVDEEGSEVDCIANTRTQAHILFDAAHNFINKVDPKKKLFRQLREVIKFPTRKGTLQVLASDSSKLDGFNSHTGIMDEVHEYRDSKIHDILASSQGARTNPLLFMITSAGFNVFGFCYEFRTTCIQILRGIKDDDSQFSLIYECDEGDDWKNDESVWEKANPSLGVTISKDFLRQQIQQVRNNPSLEVGVATKNFGIWCRTSDVWIPSDTLMQCCQKLDDNFFKDYTSFLAFDLAAVSDLTALSVCMPLDGKYYFKSWFFLPSETVKTSPNSELYKKWIREGYIIQTDGNVTDYDFVLKKILELNKITFIEKISYDSWNATSFVIDCLEQGLPLEPFSQTIGNFNRPTKELERLILSDRVVFDTNPVLLWNFDNLVLKTDHNENCKPIKNNTEGKIDGVISCIMALGSVLSSPNFGGDIMIL